MNRRLYLVAAAALLVIAGISVYVATTVDPKDISQNSDLKVLDDSVPTLAGAKGWINSPPLGRNDLAGKVVLYDFWTYSCINCQRTLPHLKALYDRYKGDGLVIIGIHSPEFDFEKDHANVARAVERYGVTWPVALDDDMAIWNAFNNQYWPAEYLTDRQGRLRQVRAGEGDYDSKENDVRTLLGIPAGAPRAAAAGADQVLTAAQTPEIHFGFAFGGDQLSSSPEKMTAGTQTYSLPDPIPQDTYALSGSWTATDQGVESGDGSASFVLRYQGAEVNLVAGAASPITVVVELDGAPLTTLVVLEHDLYHVVTNGPSGYHTLDVPSSSHRSPGVRVHVRRRHEVRAYIALFGAGVASFLAPCIVPLVPAYLGLVVGESVEARDTAKAVPATLVFIAGFALVFAGLGTAAGQLGSSLNGLQDVLERVGGVIVFVLGLVLLGVLRGRWLQERRLVHRLPEGWRTVAAARARHRVRGGLEPVRRTAPRRRVVRRGAHRRPGAARCS